MGSAPLRESPYELLDPLHHLRLRMSDKPCVAGVAGSSPIHAAPSCQPSVSAGGRRTRPSRPLGRAVARGHRESSDPCADRPLDGRAELATPGASVIKWSPLA